MPRLKKDYTPLNVKLDSEVHSMLEQYVSETRLSKTAAVELILGTYLKQWQKENKKGKKITL
jgi:hypothetical protein